MEWLANMDRWILLWIQGNLRVEALNGFWSFITHLGDYGWFWISLSVVLLFFKKTRTVGITALVALLIGSLVTNAVLKNMVARERPYKQIRELVLLIEVQKDYSFPSGHTCASFAAALVYLKLLPGKWGIPATVLAVLISFSRLYVGVHYLTDVLAGAVIGAASAYLALQIVPAVQSYLKKRRFGKGGDADRKASSL